jgi:hypothetical protein
VSLPLRPWQTWTAEQRHENSPYRYFELPHGGKGGPVGFTGQSVESCGRTGFATCADSKSCACRDGLVGVPAERRPGDIPLQHPGQHAGGLGARAAPPPQLPRMAEVGRHAGHGHRAPGPVLDLSVRLTGPCRVCQRVAGAGGVCAAQGRAGGHQQVGHRRLARRKGLRLRGEAEARGSEGLEVGYLRPGGGWSCLAGGRPGQGAGGLRRSQRAEPAQHPAPGLLVSAAVAPPPKTAYHA